MLEDAMIGVVVLSPVPTELLGDDVAALLRY